MMHGPINIRVNKYSTQYINAGSCMIPVIHITVKVNHLQSNFDLNYFLAQTEWSRLLKWRPTDEWSSGETVGTYCKAPYTLSVKLSDFAVWRHTWRKNWVNCAVFTGNSAGLRTVFSSRLSHRELRSSLAEYQSFLSLPADTTVASSHSTSVSSNSFNRWASHDIFLFKYHFLLHILRFLFYFSDNIMVDVASKQQTTALFLSTTVTRTRIHTELTKKKKKLTNLVWNLCCDREHSVQFFVQLFYIVKPHILT